MRAARRALDSTQLDPNRDRIQYAHDFKRRFCRFDHGDQRGNARALIDAGMLGDPSLTFAAAAGIRPR